MTAPETPAKIRHLVFVALDIPADIFASSTSDQSKRVSSPAIVKSVLLSLIGHYNAKRNGTEVWPSMARLADLTGLTDRSVRQAMRQLQAMDLVKVRADSGRTSVYTINEPAIRALADPGRQVRGSGPTPDVRSGVPRTRGPGTPDVASAEQAKEQQKGNSKDVFPISCSTSPKVGDGPEQRKLAVHGIVAGASRRMQSPAQEQPTNEKTGRAHGTTSIGALAVKERPG